MNTNTFQCVMAGINIKIIGSCKLAEAFRKEFAFCPVSDSSPDLTLTMLNKEQDFDFAPKYYSLSGSIAFDETSFVKKDKGFSYLCKNLFDDLKPTEVFIKYKTPNSINRFFKQCVMLFISNTAGYANYHNRFSRSLMGYSFFWYIFAMTLLKKKSAFIHGSIYQTDDNSVLLTGTGGCGKTSILFKLLETTNAKYLSEDFSVVQTDGIAPLCRKKASIYHSDVKYGQKDLIRYVKKQMKGIDKLLWNYSIFLGKNPLRKIPPELLLGEDRIAESAPISKAYYFTRYAGANVRIEDIPLDEFVTSAVNASFRELNMLFEILKNIHAVALGMTRFPAIEELQEKTSDIYTEAFQNAQAKRMYIPLKSPPEVILKVI